MSGTLVNVRIVIQNVRILGQSEVEKVKASGSSAAGVRIVSDKVRIVTQNVRIVIASADVRIVSGRRQDR